MTPDYARELADAWTHMDPVSRQGVLEEIRGMKPSEMALVAKAVFGFYGPKGGINYLIQFLDAVIADGPEMKNDEDTSTVIEDVEQPVTVPTDDQKISS